MTTLAKIRRGENGQSYSFRIVSESGTEENLASYVLAESSIKIKDPDDSTLKVTLEGSASDISFSSPNVIWKPTDAQITLLPKQNYVCFVHLIDTGASPPLETISKHLLLITDT